MLQRQGKGWIVGPKLIPASSQESLVDGTAHEAFCCCACSGSVSLVRAGAGSRLLTTQLYFPNEPANLRDVLFQPELLMRVADAADGLDGRFDFVLNVRFGEADLTDQRNTF